MGMYDSVVVNCPDCGKIVEFQSKAGKCEMETYSISSVPTEIALDLDMKKETCSSCGKQIELFSGANKFTSMQIV